MFEPTLGKNAKAAIYHVIYKGEVMRVGETTYMKNRLSAYRSKARHRKNPLPMHLAMREDWENITFKIVMYVPYAERLKWEANEKKFYGTGSKWNGHENEETHTNACVANGKNFDPELRRANGRKTGPANLAKSRSKIKNHPNVIAVRVKNGKKYGPINGELIRQRSNSKEYVAKRTEEFDKQLYEFLETDQYKFGGDEAMLRGE